MRFPLSKTSWNSLRRRTRRLLSNGRDASAKRALQWVGLTCVGSGRLAYDEETVRRFRPLARRRFKTRRPFLVLIRTRKPWVRARRGGLAGTYAS